LDDLRGRWAHRRPGVAVLVGSLRHDPYWHCQLVDRLPQRVVLASIRSSETGVISASRCKQGLPANRPRPGKPNYRRSGIAAKRSCACLWPRRHKRGLACPDTGKLAGSFGPLLPIGALLERVLDLVDSLRASELTLIVVLCMSRPPGLPSHFSVDSVKVQALRFFQLAILKSVQYCSDSRAGNLLG